MNNMEIYNKMVKEAGKNENFRQELLLNAKEALKKFDVTFPEDVEVTVYEMTDDHLHFVLPRVQGM